MLFLLLSLAVLLLGGVTAFFTGHKKGAALIGPAAAVSGCLLALIPTLETLLRLRPTIVYEAGGFALPIGRLLFSLDPLSALFLVPTLLVPAFAAFYGHSYLGGGSKNLGGHWFFYNLLIFGLILTFIAADAFLFMVAWEVMSIIPFFLIIHKDEEEKARKGAAAYLIAAHLGGLFLLAFFVLLSAGNGGTLAFAAFVGGAGQLKDAGILFLLALIGFGVKAGLMPMHIWLPEAHPAAPSHISAVLSGVVINAGIYGLVRALSFLGPGERWWAFTLMGLGALSALLGILQALSKRYLKRSLAFSSVENMGIVCMGLGFSLYAAQCGNTFLALVCAFGATLHLVNHSFYKSLLFLGAGAVAKGTGTDFLNGLGGLQKRAPFLGFCFFAGSAAICALPPMNAFAGKLILYLGLAMGGGTVSPGGVLYWAGFFILAGVSGATLFCFTRMYGLAFLGAPRTVEAESIQPPPALERRVMGAMAGLCLLSSLCTPLTAPLFVNALIPYIRVLGDASVALAAGGGIESFAVQARFNLGLGDIYAVLFYVNGGFCLFILLALALYALRKRLLVSRTIGASPTWDCGYAAPGPRIQYTGGGFSQPAIFYAAAALRPKAVFARFTSYFPGSGKAELITGDWIHSVLYLPVFVVIAKAALWTKSLQHGRTNTYILYIFITLVVLLAWKIR